MTASEPTARRPQPPPKADRSVQGELGLARAVLEVEAKAVAGAAELIGESFVKAVDLIDASSRAGGTVLVTGLGKSGLIGQKISATLASLGVASHFVHPAEAAHGDLGRFRPSDVCLALSHSGETDEVVNLVALLRQDRIPVIAITGGDPKSTLARLANCVLGTGVSAQLEQDLSPAPTASTTATLALGDALSLVAAERLGATDAGFARRHPGGALGGLLRPVMDIVRFTVGKNLIPVADDLKLLEAMRMAECGPRRPGALLLVDRQTGVLSGIFTDGDLRRLVLKGGPTSGTMRDLMTVQPMTLGENALVRDAVKIVREHRRDEIPIVDERGRPVGLMDVQDLIAMRLVRQE